MALKQSPLHDRHVALGAKLAEFGGWEMPLEYPAGVIKEHTAVRQSVGIFDVSHLGKVVVRGDGAQEYVNAALTNDLGRIGPGRAQYTLCCDDATGGIVDDLIVYLLDDDHLLLVPNAANTAEVVRRLEAGKPEGVTITDHHETHAVLAVQGTRSDEVLAAAGLPTGHGYMSFVEHTTPARSSSTAAPATPASAATSWVPDAAAPALWDALLEAGEEHGIQPCGLGARDTLRTEMGYPLHGQDISLRGHAHPGPAGLGRRLEEAGLLGPRRPAGGEGGRAVRLYGLVASGRGIARPGMR